MKRFLTFMLGICLIIPCAFMFSACGDKKDSDDEIWDGSHVAVSEAENGVIVIDTAEELAGLAKSVNSGNDYEGITIKLARDIDLANKEWTPIGYGMSNYMGEIESGYQFRGIFDGQNHTIDNLKITTFNRGGLVQGTSAGVGLFGQIYQAEVKNLNVEDANVKGNHYVGAIVGFSVDSNITNCHVDDAIIDCVYSNADESGDKAGAVVGHFAKGIYNASVATILNCSAEDCIVKADRDAGQVIGCLSNGATNTDNTAEEVTVSWNQSGSTPGKSNTNINNTVVGRIS